MRSALQKALLLLLLSTPLAAQNCALCYTQAAADSKLKSALKSGILILMFPPMMISTGLIVTAYRRRNRFHQDDVATKDDAVSKNESDLGW